MAPFYQKEKTAYVIRLHLTGQAISAAPAK